MDREEALKIVRENYPHFGTTEPWLDLEKALATLIPELAESEDERIRKELVAFFKDKQDSPWREKYWHDLEIDHILAYLEKQKEPKPAESISQLPVQGKGVYKICPRCKERMVRDDSMVYTSMPPQYRYECPKCGESECDTVMYDNPEMEEQKEQKIWKVGENAYFEPNTDMWFIKKEQKPAEWSEEDEKMLQSIIKDFRAGKVSTIGQERWLKSLRPQQRQEWSDEEKEILDSILSHYVLINKPTDANGIPKEKYISLIKSLRFDTFKNCNSHWKPSEEQMEALESAVKLYKDTHFEIHHKKIVSLYEQLKKLM